MDDSLTSSPKTPKTKIPKSAKASPETKPSEKTIKREMGVLPPVKEEPLQGKIL